MLALCVLVKLGEEPCSALRRIKRARAGAGPSPAQLIAFQRWYEREMGKESPSFETLAHLAYHATPRELAVDLPQEIVLLGSQA